MTPKTFFYKEKLLKYFCPEIFSSFQAIYPKVFVSMLDQISWVSYLLPLKIYSSSMIPFFFESYPNAILFLKFPNLRKVAGHLSNLKL